jgi:hypothetical protein
MVAAANSYVITIDNVSHLPDWLSDDLAVLSTGGGLSKRELYSDADESVLKAQRPIVLTGISHAITRPDLLDRAIVLTLPMISDEKRQPEALFWGAFTQAHPRILGALLDAVVVALKMHTTIKLAALPRMADFAIWGVAAESACPWEEGTFLSEYLGNRQGAVESTLDGDPVADVIRAIAPWTGTATELLAVFTEKVSPVITARKDWFSKPRQVSDALRRLAPNLRRIGIDVMLGRRSGRNRNRLIEIKRIESSALSASSAEPDAQADQADDVLRLSAASSAGSSASPAQNVNICGLADDADAGDAAIPLSSGALPTDEVGIPGSRLYAEASPGNRHSGTETSTEDNRERY